MTRRHAFTLVELLVVIAIIALLMGLLLPGVSKLREIRAKSASAKTIQEIGQLTMQYLATNGTLPSSPPDTYTYETNLAAFLRAQNFEIRTEDVSGNDVLDGFGEPIVVEVVRTTHPTLNKVYISRIRLCSQGRKTSGGATAAAVIDDATANLDDVLYTYDANAKGQGGFVRTK